MQDQIKKIIWRLSFGIICCFPFFAGYIKSTSLLRENFWKAIYSKLPQTSYILIIDGGGSKTEFRVLDSQGKPQPLWWKAKKQEVLLLGSSNINNIGEAGFEALINTAFQNLEIGEKRIRFSDLKKNILVIGGISGCAEQNKIKAQNCFERQNFDSDKVFLAGDIQLNAEIIGSPGALLIAGTGTVCFGKNEANESFILGGLGPYYGDEGGGFYIGCKAIKKASRDEGGWGIKTSLTTEIKKKLNVKELKGLFPQIRTSKITTAKIATLAPLVFEKAAEGDAVAQKILHSAEKHLATLLNATLQKINCRQPYVYLFGGLFKSEHASLFIENLTKKAFSFKEKEQQPIVINLSEINLPMLVVQRKIKEFYDTRMKPLASLPQFSKADFESFKKKYHLKKLSTESSHPKTENLSSQFRENPEKCLKTLFEVDESIVDKFHYFATHHLDSLAKSWQKNLKQGGRIILVGAGTSGRIAVDLAAKWKNFWRNRLPKDVSYKNKVLGIMAGGFRAFIRAKEGFEDSQEAGYQALKSLSLSSKDVVVLISASGSATFHIGAAKFAHQKETESYYFYCSQTIPKRTEDLFQLGISKPLLIDIGPQTITGSTRLQAATLTELCLGTVFLSLVQNMTGKNMNVKDIAEEILQSLLKGNQLIKIKLPEIARLVGLEVEIFSSPKANIRKISDCTSEGYVTFLSGEDSIREIMIDSAETAPTFSVNPPRSLQENKKKKAEFRAYLTEEEDNLIAWKKLVGKKIPLNQQSECKEILVAAKALGFGSYDSRPKGKGNLLIGVSKENSSEKNQLSLLDQLKQQKALGGKVAFIDLAEKIDPSFFQKTKFLNTFIGLEGIKKDALGIVPTILLKQILNLVSNGSMIGMKKVLGNIMVDVSLSNKKLIDRGLRIITTLYRRWHPYEQPLDEEYLFNSAINAYQYKIYMEQHFGQYVPTPVKLILTMLERQIGLFKAISLLQKNNEDLEQIRQQ